MTIKNLPTSILALLVLLLVGCKDEENDTIKFITSADYPPFEYLVDGEITGFEIELAKLIAAELGKDAVFEHVNFSTALASVQNGLADAAISTITITEERKQNVDFSIPYYTDRLVMVSSDSKPIKDKSQIADKKIACQLGTTMAIWLKTHVPNADTVLTDNNLQAIEMLKVGHVDGVFIDAVQGEAFSKQNEHLSYALIAQSDEGYGIAFKKGAPLRDKVDKAIETLTKNGALKALATKWLSAESINTNNNFEMLFSYAASIGNGIFITLALLAGGITIGLLLGILLSVLRYQNIGATTITVFISIIRGTPLILQLSIFYYTIPMLTGIKQDVLVTGILTFGLNSSAYVAEILRAGIENIPKGQFEAAKSLKIPNFYLWKDIILPQVIKNILPAMTSEVITLLKETSLISTIGGMDIMRKSQTIAAEHLTYFMPLCIAGVYYYLLVMLVEYIGRKVEKKGSYDNSR